MLENGTLVDGKYKILGRIGKGGMSVVYMAMNEKANKTWAIKEVRKDGVIDFESVKQGLIVETEMLKNLNHPNLPSIIDVIENNDNFLIVMDYIEGNPLSKSIEEFGAQPQEDVIKWAKQLCDVLGYLHTRKPPIIYRDMKPSNIMLKPDGNLTLIDFGTAREFKEKNIADTTCLGTIGYAAPEQFGGMGQTDARTDIYCLGATLYHLVTGLNPSEPPYDIYPIRQINPSLSSGLEKIIMKCVQRNPADRYQSCAELMYSLEHYEEIDDIYRKKQKKKVASFIASSVLCLICAGLSIGLNLYSKRQADVYYAEKLEQAAKSPEYNEKVQLYKDAINIDQKAGDKRAYLALIQLFKENDYAFTVDEQDTIISLIKNNRNKILENKKDYAEICFELGKLFWYYYDYGSANVSDNRITKMKSAIDWFDDVVIYGEDDDSNAMMSKIYRDIGKFYRDISINTVEANDKGVYLPFFNNLSDLLNELLQNENESEIVKLELYELARSAIQQYATKFKSDGIEQEQMKQMVTMIAENIEKVEVTTDKTKEMKEKTISLLDDTYKAILIAFGS